MIKEINVFGRRFIFFSKKIHKTAGVNSNLKDGRHVLFFDFDNVDLETVKKELYQVMFIYQLPSVTILSTGRPNSFHAFCFKRKTLTEALHIVLDCPHIDKVFVMMAFKRGWFTLRISEKNGRTPTYLTTLHSNFQSDCTSNDLDKFTIYETGKS